MTREERISTSSRATFFSVSNSSMSTLACSLPSAISSPCLESVTGVRSNQTLNMRSSLISAHSSSLNSSFSRNFQVFGSFGRKKEYTDWTSNGFLKIPILYGNLSVNSRINPSRLITVFSTEAAKPSSSKSMNRGGLEVETESEIFSEEEAGNGLTVEVGSPNFPTYLPAAKLSLSDQAFFLLAFIACTTSIAFTSLVIAAVPTLYAMGRAATSLSKLADTAREELPSTMAAIRLSGMEISDLTLELSDLSQEIADGVNKSAQAVQAAEAGIRKMGSIARQQTISMIQERASLPVISLQPVVAGAARKTSHAVGRATKNIMNIISRGEFSCDNDDDGTDRMEL